MIRGLQRSTHSVILLSEDFEHGYSTHFIVEHSLLALNVKWERCEAGERERKGKLL